MPVHYNDAWFPAQHYVLRTAICIINWTNPIVLWKHQLRAMSVPVLRKKRCIHWANHMFPRESDDSWSSWNSTTAASELSSVENLACNKIEWLSPSQDISDMPPKQNRRWNFLVHGTDILVIRDNEELASLCVLRYGPVKLITSGKEHTRGIASKEQALLVSFTRFCLFIVTVVYSQH